MRGLPDFTVGGALRRTFDVVKHHFGTLLALATVLYALPIAVLAALPRLGLVPDTAALRAAGSAGRPASASGAGALIAYGLVAILVVFICSLLATAAVVWVAHEGLDRRPAGFGGGAARALRVLPADLAMVVLMSLGFMVGFLLLVVPGVMLVLRWSVAIPVLVVERAGILGSLRRSRDLTRGHRWAILGFLLVLALIAFVVVGAIGFGGAMLSAALGGTAGANATLVVNLVVNATVSAFSGAATAALYVELRRAGEGGLTIETAEAFA